MVSSSFLSFLTNRPGSFIQHPKSSDTGFVGRGMIRCGLGQFFQLFHSLIRLPNLNHIVPLHDNLGEDDRDNPGEAIRGFRDKPGTG
jgi:hypothetical protein